MRTAAIILTGGRSRRFGRHKPSALWQGRPLVSYALAATAGLDQLVVGLGDDVPADIPAIRETPPGGGPVAAIAAGVSALAARGPYDVVVVVAADLPLLGSRHIDRLIEATSDRPALFVDPDGRLQWLAAAWPMTVLRDRLTALGDPVDQSMRRLYAGLDPVTLADPDGAASHDIDTPGDLDALDEPKTLDDDAAAPRRFARAAEEDT